MPPPDGEGDVAAHRETHHDGAADTDLDQELSDVVCAAIDAERACGRRFSEAAKVEGNAPPMRREGARLRSPHRAIQRKCVKEHHSRSFADIVVSDRRAADLRDHVSICRHHSASGQSGSSFRQSSGTRTGRPSCPMVTKTMFARATSRSAPTLWTSCRTM